MNVPLTDHIVAGTGSRSLRTAPVEKQRAAADTVTAKLQERLGVHGVRLVVISGMAEGFDELLAVSALKLGIRLWCVVPNKGYGPHYWGRNSVTGVPRLMAFGNIIDRAWRVTYVMEDVHGARGLNLNGVHSNFVRNDWMVEQADEFLVWGPIRPRSGTEQCYRSIKRVGKPYEILSAAVDRPERMGA